MDPDTVLIHHLMNPCCRALKEKYSNIVASRKALRDGVKIQTELIDKLENEKLLLKKAYEEEMERANAERLQKSKESAYRVSLEKEIDVLKREIHALHQREGSKSEAQDADSELLLLRTRHTEMEAEINKLKKIIEEEKVHTDVERQEKSKELANRVTLEKEIGILKTEIHSLQQREDLKSNAEDVGSESLFLRTRHAEMEIEINKLKALAKEEKIRADAERLEKAKETATRESLEKEISSLKVEIHSLHQKEGSKSKAQDSELSFLRKRHTEMEAEINKLKELAEVEKGRTDRLVDAERKKVVESRILLENLKSKTEEARSQLVTEALKFEEANKRLELERHKVVDEKRRADVETTKVENQKKLAEMYQKKAIDEKSRADHLSQQLEEHKQRIQNLQKQAQEHVSLRNVDAERKEVEENRILLENLKSKAEEARSQLVTEALKFEKANKELELERHKVVDEKRRADVETAKVEKQKKLAEMYQKKAMDEKSRADHLSQQLEEHKQRIQTLQKQVQEHVSLRNADAEQRKVEENRILLENLKSKAEEARSQLVTEALKFEEANKKLELEKHKVIDEKRRADVETVKVEKLKKLVEMYQKKVMDEKSRADHLSQQLEEQKQRIQNLQNQVQEHASLRKSDEASANPSDKLVNSKYPMMRSGVDVLGESPDESKSVLDDSESGKVYERLREEKQKVMREKKHADTEMNRAKQLKKVAEVSKNKALEEKCRADQLARQFEDQSRKIDHLQNEISVLKSSRSSFVVPVDLSSADMNSKIAELEMMRKHLKLKKKQVKHAKDVAKLESDRKDMLQQKLDSITREFVQLLQRMNVLDDCFTQQTEGRDRSNKGIVYNSSDSNLPREILSKYSNQVQIHRDDEAVKSSLLAVDVSGASKQALNCSAPLLPASGGNSTRCFSGTDFRTDTLLRCPERKMFESSAINSTLASFSDRPLMASQGKGALAVTAPAKLPGASSNSQSKVCSPMKSHDTKSKHRRKRKSITDAVEILYPEGKKWPMRVEENLNSRTEKSLQEKSIFEQHPEKHRAKKRRKELSVEEVSLQLSGPSELIQGNYMKLLDLDDAVDEDCYRKAVERPLSPFVPKLDFQISDTTVYSEKNNLVQSCHHEDVNMEIDKLIPCHKEIPHHSPPSENDNFACIPEDATYKKRCEGNTVCEDIASPQHIQQSHEMMGTSGVCRSGYSVTYMPCESNPRLTSARTPKYCVVFSNNKHESSISRIYRAIKICMDQWSMTLEMDEVILKFIVGSLKMEDLLPRERASVVFSVLLNFSETALELRKSWPSNVIHLSDSFARCLHTVLSDAETESRFVELCFSGELHTLIEEFLLDGRLLVHTYSCPKTSPTTGFKVNILLDEEQITLSRTLASRCQLLHGSVTLASICKATNHIGFLCEASHNILRFHKSDNLLALDMLHVFAYVCGPKYFALEDYSLTMTVVKSLVTVLGRKSVSRGHACCLQSVVVEVQRKFPSCIKCPFSEGSVSIDVVISLLLEKLQDYAFSVSHENIEHHLEAYDSRSVACSASCCLNKFAVATVESISVHDENFCCFTDVISLVELVASKMHWDWTCNKIVPQMLKLLDQCAVGNFFTIVVIFLVKLGRLGVDASGYDDKVVESLRSRLAALLYQNSSKEVDPLNFEKLLKTEIEIVLPRLGKK